MNRDPILYLWGVETCCIGNWVEFVILAVVDQYKLLILFFCK